MDRQLMIVFSPRRDGIYPESDSHDGMMTSGSCWRAQQISHRAIRVLNNFRLIILCQYQMRQHATYQVWYTLIELD